MSNTQSSQPRYTRHELTVSDDLPDNGGVTLPNAILLAEGVWHDSLGPDPVTYTAANLAAAKIRDPTGWRSHANSHSLEDDIGEVKNVHYDPAAKALVGDLYFHGLTDASRNVLGGIRARHATNLPVYVSVEHVSNDIPTPSGLTATDITLTGWIATVNPACTKCSIPVSHGLNAGQNMTNDPTPTPDPKYASVEDVAKLREELAAMKAASEKTTKEAEIIKTKLEDNKKELAAASERIKQLESAPGNKAPTGVNEHALAAHTPAIQYDEYGRPVV